LDEPTSGLDPNQIIEIRNVIKQQGQNKTVLFSSHISFELEAKLRCEPRLWEILYLSLMFYNERAFISKIFITSD